MIGDLGAHLPPAYCVQQFLTKNIMTPVPHLSYSSALTCSDSFLFPQMKKVLKGKHCAHVEQVKQAKKQKMAEALKSIKIKEFKNCFEQ